jgi:hypothetical protein
VAGLVYTNMAAVGTGRKRRFNVSRKNDYVPDTSEELVDTRHAYQVIH